jgi:maltooligosyltrehalose trehalohydrolase
MSTGRLEIGAALVALGPFVPMLFQGEEWGASTPFQYFTDHQDPELGRAVSEGRRHEFSAFGWSPEDVPDPQDPATFERSKLQWSELDQPEHRALAQWHRTLLRLRRRFGELTDGRLAQTHVGYDEAARWLVLRRGRVIVAVNLSAEPGLLRLPVASGETAEVIAQGSGGAGLAGVEVRLPPDGVAIVAVST